MEKDEIPVVLQDGVHVKVPVVCPIWRCEGCGLEWMDHEASTIRDDAVNAYLFKVGQGRPKEWSPKWNLEK